MAELPDLADLIAVVNDGEVTADPIEQLAAASRVRVEVDELSEALLDHFVQRARDAGYSWSQIGSALGVSKQAAQQRHMATRAVARRLLVRLFERPCSEHRFFFGRFTDRARTTVVLAQQEARALNHNYVGTEHILLGLLREGDGVAAKALSSMGISEQQVRGQVTAIIGEGEEAPVGHIPFTPKAKKVLELAMREARHLGHNYLGTEHILLGLLRAREGVAAEILEALGVDLERSREGVIGLLARDG